MLSAIVACVTVAVIQDRLRQKRLSETRPPLRVEDFTAQFVTAGLPEAVAEFIWDEFQPHYYKPLTPYPSDRPVSGMRVDPDDLSDMITSFERKFDRSWTGQWVGSVDPTLIEFARGLLASTSDR